MCHTIESGIRFLLCEDHNSFIGMKELSLVEEKDEGRWIRTTFRKNSIVRDEAGYWTVHSPIREQDLDLVLVGLAPYKKRTIRGRTAFKKVQGGIHISPSINEGSLRLERAYIKWVNTGRQELWSKIPVIFHLEDIVFFDGVNVSVERFTPLDEEMMEDLVGAFPEQVFDLWEVVLKEWMKELNGVEIPLIGE